MPKSTVLAQIRVEPGEDLFRHGKILIQGERPPERCTKSQMRFSLNKDSDSNVPGARGER